ncbi:MAG: glycosyltransferase [Prolixibacteraceae bacterium]|nr:glycosyltransferase [Prolixibacteraceae bacterium]
MIPIQGPLVSICCLTFNHEFYIRECIIGFISQKTSFTFEVLIHDDASSDNTANIIREYEAKYPDIIKPIYQTENQYSKGVGVTRTYQFPRAKGKYIALCEGDDYWTDPLKLQKQINFLEENSTFSGCYHACKIEYQESAKKTIVRHKGNSEIDLGYFLKNSIFVATHSLVFKKEIIKNIPVREKSLFAGDFELRYHILADGNLKYLDDVMGVYRKGVPGSWSKNKITFEKVEKEYFDNLLVLFEINRLTNYKYQIGIMKKVEKLYSRYVARNLKLLRYKEKLVFFISNLSIFRLQDYKTIIKGVLK